MHWWNPPHLIPLIEVTKGDASSQEAAEVARDMGLRAGKKPVIIQKDILGIVGNRLQFAVLREALHILELGAADARAIDDVMKYGPGFRYRSSGRWRG
jgi:3-hydroxybutyryl-CoA dehydrogenase